MTPGFSNRFLDRRTLLRAGGVALALPWLDAMAPALLPSADAPQRRALFVFLPNGVKMDEWRPEGQGALAQLPHLLAPLQPVRERLTVWSGLALDGGRAHGDGPGDHARAAASFLTCAHPRKTGGKDLAAGLSTDQAIAQRIGAKSRFPSLELGLERGAPAGVCDSGYACAYSNSISWRGPSAPAAKETEPRALFARLFGDPDASDDAAAKQRQNAQRRSLLDLVLEDAKRLRRELGGGDRHKLDEYLGSVRAFELRLSRDAALQPETPLVPESVRAARGDYQKRIDAMYELLALAFQTGQTQVASLMLGNAGSNRSYRFLGVGSGHHDLSHHGRDPRKLDGVRTIVRFHMERFAAFLVKLQGMRDGGGSLLDQTLCVFGSGISDGDRHNHEDLPMLLAGGHRGGRHVVFAKETPVANLHLAVLQAMGLSDTSFGDSAGALELRAL